MTAGRLPARRFTIAKSFIDTNIFIYSQDSASTKQVQARDLLRTVLRSGDGVVSTQVMQEFYQNLIRKLGAAPVDAADIVLALRQFEVVQVSPDLISEAMAFHATRRTSFWDALIVCAAAFAKCSVLYSEDMAHGQSLLGVKIQNPFAG